jgi:signal transduction histidine kinase
MGINPFRTLQGKFTFYLSIFIVATMSALAYWNISREKRLLQDAIIREGKALVESFAIACTNTMLYEEIGLVEEGGLLDNYISDLMQRKDLQVVYAMILDPEGKAIAHNLLMEVGTLYQDERTQKSIASWETILQYPSESILDISAPLAISTKRWGTLRIGISLETLKKEITTLILRYIFFTAAFIILAIGITAALFGLITKPIRSLSREMDSISAEGSSALSATGQKDEIGVLKESFYGMLRRIRETEREKERTQRTLLQTEKMVAIGKLTAGVAHEINNPLGGILNCIYHFRKGGRPIEKQREYLDLMEDGIKRIQKTVMNLLEYVRNPRFEPSASDLRVLIEKSLSLLDYPIQKNQIRVEVDLSSNLPLILVDKDQMVQVLVNVFLNAIHAMQDTGGVLRIGAGSIDHLLTLNISDTGAGISEDVLPKVFDPFFTTKGGEEKGTGLGLWLTQQIVERHGGTIQLSSQQGKGTTVKIELPLGSG